jgi:hypothetical protein
MADLLQSSATTATQAPSYYNTYLSNLATNSQTAADAAKFAGEQALQKKAFTGVEANVGNYLPALTTAQGTLGQATATSPLSAANPYFQNANVDPSQLAQGYMSPYTQDVVNSIGTLGQRNIQQNLAPQATAGAVGSGQFGSQRGAQVLGQTIQNANTDILAQQNQALQAGYTQALQAAQKQQALEAQLGQSAGSLAATGQGNLINAATVGGNLAGQTQTLGLGDVNALATLGGQQQTIAQNAQLFPLQKLAQQAALMKGYTVPTTSVQSFQGSPLSAVASLGSLGAGMFTKNTSGTSPAENLAGALGSGYNWLKNWATGTPSSDVSLTTNTNSGTTGYTPPANYGFTGSGDTSQSLADWYNTTTNNNVVPNTANNPYSPDYSGDWWM